MGSSVTNVGKRLRQILLYPLLAIAVFVLLGILITRLNAADHSNVTEQEATQCIQMIRSNLPWFHRLNITKFTLHKPNQTRYTAFAYGLYGGIWLEIDVQVRRSYEQALNQDVPFTCEGVVGW